MNETTVTLICAILGSGVVSTLLNFILDFLKNKKSKQNVALRMTMYYILKESSQKYIEKGKINTTDLAAFNCTYQAYKDLGGDGWAEEVYKLVNNLEVEV